LIPGATYHVYCRVAGGEFVFEGDFEAVEFIGTPCTVGELDESALRFEQVSGFSLDDLVFRFHSSKQIDGRIVLSTVAVSRYGFRACDIAALIGKHGSSATKWLTEVLRKEGVDQEFKSQVDGLDAAISRRG